MKKKISYFYVLLLLFLSGNPAISIFGNPKIILAIFTFLLFFLIEFNFNKISSDLKRYLLFFVFIFILQIINLSFFSVLGAVHFLFKIMFGYLVLVYCGKEFRKILFNLIYFISFISLICFGLNLIGYNMPIFLNKNVFTIIFYNQQVNQLFLRNSGFFWEPGAFAIFLNFTIVIVYDSLKNIRKHKLLIIFLALITTFSTTGYIMFFVILLHLSLNYFKYKVISFFVSIALSSILYFLYFDLYFLNTKVEDQFLKSSQVSKDFSNTRIGSLIFDLHYIKKSPIYGNGLHENTRFEDHKWLINEDQLGHGNGFSNFIASMGITSMLLYLFYLYKSLIQNKFFVLFLIIVALQGEQLLNFPFFLILPFIFRSFVENIIIVDR